MLTDFSTGHIYIYIEKGMVIIYPPTQLRICNESNFHRNGDYYEKGTKCFIRTIL